MTAIQPEHWPAATVPLSPGVRAGDFVYISGVVAQNPDGSFVTGSLDDEVNGAIDRIEDVIEAAGGSLSDIVNVTAYLANAAIFPLFNALYAARFGPTMPARATLVVGFAHPDVRVELSAVGYLKAT